MKRLCNLVKVLLLCAAFAGMHTANAQEGLLFYLSGDRGLEADHAAGNPIPNYVNNISFVNDGAQGQGIRCGYLQLLTYWAPQNIYAQRGTLSFYWRSALPVDETEFPVFRVGYADHSSWDMAFLRIDWNGHGFDAFVTDVNLARVRTSYKMPKTPAPDQWVHLALAWDENTGIRLYVDGQLAGKKDSTVVLNAGLDQFGPHSRVISPYQVQSRYCFIRSGDIDEVKIYDHALNASQVTDLAAGKTVSAPAPVRDLAQAEWKKEWLLRYGWDRPGDLPPYLENEATTVRKVQILEAYDLKRWWWKANDGIRETTWPGVYNQSRLPGRTDYFILPDWDCYTLSGQQVRFNMPDEPWNYLEVSSGADGKISLTPNSDGTGGRNIFTRPSVSLERTFHKMDAPVTGQTVVFTNNHQENPIGEFDAFYIHSGDAPRGVARLSYTLSSRGNLKDPTLVPIEEYIYGRFPADEVSILIAQPGRTVAPARPAPEASKKMPLAHIVIPADFRSGMVNNALEPGASSGNYTWNNIDAGLDGIRITLPAMNVAPLAGGLFPMNIQVKDPIWPLRNMLDYSFSIKPNEGRVLWLDLRDRILPVDKPLYITVAGAGADFNAALLEGARIELVFKDREEAKKEHVADRFTQVRDNHAMIIEERPNDSRLNKYVQIEADMTDLLAVDPNHKEGREYWYEYNPEQPRPETEIAPAPAGVPEWAYLQLEYLKEFRHFVEWQIDNRQISNGEFGGGLSDDSDFGNYIPALTMMGVIPEKTKNSLSRMLEAIYREKMLKNGVSAIQTDMLHTYEEGVNVVGEMNLVSFGDPKQVERLMECAYAAMHYITAINPAGHRHARSEYFGANRMATGVWGWQNAYIGLHLISAMQMAEFYGNPTAKQLILEMADGLLAHAKVDANGRTTLITEIHFETDTVRPSSLGNILSVLWSAWKLTGEAKYLKPIADQAENTRIITSDILNQTGLRKVMAQAILDRVTPTSGTDYLRHLAWQATGDKAYLEGYYADNLRTIRTKEYINTLGMLWTDRVAFPLEPLQRSRMGGVGSARNTLYPGNTVSWSFDGEQAEQVAILMPVATPREFEVELFNTANHAIDARMTGADVLGGQWKLSWGSDTNGDGLLDSETRSEQVTFGRGETVTLSIPPRTSVMIKMTVTGQGEKFGNRADLAIGRDDIRLDKNRATVTVHNLGPVDAPATPIALVDAAGKTVATANIPALASAADLLPKRVAVTLTLPRGVDPANLNVVIDPEGTLKEITKTNNALPLAVR